MTQSIVRSIVTALALSGCLLAITATSAADEATGKTVIPQTSDGIWQAIDTNSAELKKTIEAGALANVHHKAYAIRDLVAALPGRSASLTTDQLAVVRTNGKFVATLAERLDAAGDAGDVVATKEGFEKLTRVLTTLRAAYRPQK